MNNQRIHIDEGFDYDSEEQEEYYDQDEYEEQDQYGYEDDFEQVQQDYEQVIHQQQPCSDSGFGVEQSQQMQLVVDVDYIIEKLLQLGNQKPGKKADITEQQIFGIVGLVRQIFKNQKSLLQLEAPIQVCGDIHGQYYDLLRLLAYGGLPPTSSYLFLGDYVDRGLYGIQTICLLFSLKIKYPKNIYLLRGNHESASISKIYGFYNQCKKRYNNIKIWKCFNSAFVYLPVSAIINQRILCMHGGLSPQMHQVSDIKRIVRPQQVPDQGILCDLLWADPTVDTTGWAQSERGCSFIFGSDVTSSFLKANDLDLICRAHQVVQDGYQFCHKKRILTLFSAPNYCGEFNNAGAFMKVDADLLCSFHILKPEDKLCFFKNIKPNSSELTSSQ